MDHDGSSVPLHRRKRQSFSLRGILERSHAPLSQARDRAYGVGGGVAVVPDSLAERMRLLVESMMGEMEEMELLEITLARLKAENAALRARIKQLELQITPVPP